MLDWYLKPIRNYVEFSGRSRRMEYWVFGLGNFIIGLVLQLLALAADPLGIISLLFSLFIFLPSLAVTVRRLHDIGKSGWWFLIVLVPIVGPIILLVFMFLDSEDEPNKYGTNPKMETAA